MPSANECPGDTSGHVGNDLQFSAQRFDDSLQCADVHVILRFQPGQCRLRDAHQVGHLLLRQPRQPADFPQQHRRKLFLDCALIGSTALGRHSSAKFVEVASHQINPSFRSSARCWS
jgi:hypothetical protein